MSFRVIKKEHIPMISLVGRPNVGKSSLFNAMTRRRQALVADYEGVTRDRRFGEAKIESLGKNIRVCDTGGWMPEAWRKDLKEKELLQNIEIQIIKALEESAVIVLVMNIREGVTALDEEIVRFVRKLGKPFVIAANKADKEGEPYQIADFFQLGAEEILPISAEHKIGFESFWERLLPFFGEYGKTPTTPEDNQEALRVCIVGRPNVGKSSLLNQLVGENRSVASAEAGTTTDPVDVEVEFEGKRYIVVDTAGIRRHARRKDDIEDLGVMYAERNLSSADVAFLVFDAQEGITAQDSKIASLVEDSGCTAIVLANKWDKAPREIHSASDALKKFRERMEKEVPFLDYAPLVAISAEQGRLYGAVPGSDKENAEEPYELPNSLAELWPFASRLVAARELKISPAELHEVVQEAIAIGPQWMEHTTDFRNLHQVGNRPPQFLAQVKDANKIPEALRRYLSRSIRERFGYRGNPIRWVFRHKR